MTIQKYILRCNALHASVVVYATGRQYLRSVRPSVCMTVTLVVDLKTVEQIDVSATLCYRGFISTKIGVRTLKFYSEQRTLRFRLFRHAAACVVTPLQPSRVVDNINLVS